MNATNILPICHINFHCNTALHRRDRWRNCRSLRPRHTRSNGLAATIKAICISCISLVQAETQVICLTFRNEHDALREKLQNLEKKILVGGENLLEKAEVQEQLLEASARELEERRRKEEQLRQALQQKEVQSGA